LPAASVNPLGVTIPFVPKALDIGSHFAIREGGKTLGSGVITEVDGVAKRMT
jgi:translation elongation factor EF-Tu-like GTPase